MSSPEAMPSATRPIKAKLAEVVRSLKEGQRIRITQTVRMNSRWSFKRPVEGVFRHVNYLRTGLATDRVAEDDIIVAMVHFTKDNGELSSITLDSSSSIEVIGNAP
jgi:hypothetical protein